MTNIIPSYPIKKKKRKTLYNLKEVNLAWIQQGLAKKLKETKDLDCFNGAARHQISQLPLESEVKEAMCSPACFTPKS